MGQVINPNTPGKIRSNHLRSIAEILYRMGGKKEVDRESKDMAACIVYLLREIKESVTQTMEAWEKRDYWIKSERFYQEWEWVEGLLVQVEQIVSNDTWEQLPEVMAKLYPHIGTISIKRLTRSPKMWKGAYQRLLKQQSEEGTVFHC